MPKIAQKVIDELKNKDLVTAIQKYVPDLKKKGANYIACSPFSDEKTPSFNVSPSKGLFKCFSTGFSGFDIIKFHQLLNSQLDFPETIKELCYDFGIEIVFEDITPEQEEEERAKRAERKEMKDLMEFALAHYLETEVPEEWRKARHFKKATLDHFQIGFAVDSWDAFTSRALLQNFSEELLIKSGLVRKSEKGGKLYDFFRDRVMFPIFDKSNTIVAFTGRAMKPSDKNPKYVHTAGAPMGALLFGLKQAKDHFKESKGYLVEGPTDVLRVHEKGTPNVVCSCGSSLTDLQIKVLQKMGVDTLGMIPDNDRKKQQDKGKNPGIVALHRNAELAYTNGINNVRVLIPSKFTDKDGKMTEVIEDFDPDSFMLRLRTPQEVEQWQRKEQDYLTEYLLEECERLGLQGPAFQVEQHQRMADLINAIADDTYRSTYHDFICSRKDFWKLFKKNHQVKERKHKVDLAVLKDISKEQQGDFFKYGFQEKNGCYIFDKGSEASNFTLDVLFYVYSNDDAKFVCLFKHANGRKRIKPISAKDFITLNALKGALVNVGPNWQFTGNQFNLDKIKMKIFEGVKEANEPAFLGYDPNRDFYTWANGIYYKGRFFPADKYGVVTLKKSIESVDQFMKLESDDQISVAQYHYIIKNSAQALADKIGMDKLLDLISDKEVYLMEYYFLPFATSLKGLSQTDGNFQFERKFRYHHESEELSFDDWAKQMVLAYADNGKVMICFIIMALFRDIVYNANDGWIPMLNHHGMPGSGKSKAAESLSWMFGNTMPDGVNLEYGSSEAGIRRHMAAIQNSLIWLNEYKNNIHEGKRVLIKSIADGSGSLKGARTGGNEVVARLAMSTAIICGQDIPTIDPALIERCVFSDFNKADRNREAYDTLKAWEKKGRSTHVTCELLNHRETIAGYTGAVRNVSKQIEVAAKDKGIEADDRLILNLASMLTPVSLLMEEGKLNFPFTFDEILSVLVERLELQVTIKKSEDDVEKFFTMLSYCINQREVIEGQHYEIRGEKGGNKLYLRLRDVMPMYSKACRMTGEVIALRESTLKGYMMQHPSKPVFHPKNVRFSQLTNPTSALVFDYDVLLSQGIELNTATELSTGNKTNYQFFRDLLNGFAPGDTISFENICERLSKHSGKRVVTEQIMNNYLLDYHKDDEAKHTAQTGIDGITLMERVVL